MREPSMCDQKVKALVDRWSAYERDLDVFDSWFDAYTEEPEVAWRALLEIVKRDLTDDEKALLAAGPLEGLIAWHGEDFIDRVEDEAKRNPKFNHLLGGVWRQDMPLEIWERIERARKEVW